MRGAIQWRMRVGLWAMLLATLVGVILSGREAFAARLPILVVLAEDQSPNFDERHLMDRLSVTMIRNAVNGRYATVSFLVDDLADRSVFFRAISTFIREGYEVDVFVLASGSGKEIPLSRGNVSRADLLAHQSELHRSGPGGLRFIYTTSGDSLDSTWRELGARSVLSQDGSVVAPFFFPKFIKHWGEGESIREAAANAATFSTKIAGAFQKFIPYHDLIATGGGVVAPAPRFSGEDLDVTGGHGTREARLEAVKWPDDLPVQSRYRHAMVSEGLIMLFSRALSPKIALDSQLIPGIDNMLDTFGSAVWDTVHGIFPGSDKNEISVPGTDARMILSRMIPGFNKYFQELIDHIDALVVTQGSGKIQIEIRLEQEWMRFEVREESVAKYGQPYAARLEQVSRFEITTKDDEILIDKVQGISMLIKLPAISDAVNLRKISLDTECEQLTIKTDAAHGFVHLVAKANVRSRTFTGLDWLATMFKNWPLLIGILYFSPIAALNAVGD